MWTPAEHEAPFAAVARRGARGRRRATLSDSVIVSVKTEGSEGPPQEETREASRAGASVALPEDAAAAAAAWTLMYSASGDAFGEAVLRNAGVDTWWPVLGAPASRCSVPCASSGGDHVGLANRLPRRPNPQPASNLSRRGKVLQCAVRCISKEDGVEVKEELPKKVRAEELPPGAPLPSSVGYDPIVWSYMWRQYAAMAPSWTATPLVTRDGKALPPPPPAFVRDSVPAPLPAYLSQGPPVLVDPGRVVPLSDSQKFERHYQPNVALAPPKVRDKAARVSLKDLSTAHLSQDAHEKIAIYMQEQQQLERGVEVECIKRECSPTPMCLQRSTPNAVAAVTPSAPPHLRATPTHQPPQPPRKVCSPDTSSRHPELELSTTDSDTDSVGSVSNRSETVEEAEALLRGWSDRAAASKVAQLVADLATRLAVQERQNAALRQRFDAQTRDHNHAVASLRNQLLSINVTRDTKEEDQLRQKVCAMEGELRALRAELRPRPTPSVIAPTSPVKTEPCDVTDTC
nr:uncharacterized protein LOC113830005 [Penaeus vannamei]